MDDRIEASPPELPSPGSGGTSDELVLRVSSRSNPHRVAGAIAGLLREGREVALQAVGAGAVNQAVKAIAIARSFLEGEFVDVALIPSFRDISIDGEDRTALRIEVAGTRVGAAQPQRAR